MEFLSSSKINKYELAEQRLEANSKKNGLVCAFSTLELCNILTAKPNHTTEKLEITFFETKCKHYYFYYNDLHLGFMFIKLQATFPFNVQIYFNGREYLAKKLEKKEVSYEMYNNSFSYLEDFNKAQKFSEDFLNKNLIRKFNGLINKINPFISEIKEKLNHSYYWCIDQCEYATDINFINQNELKKIFKKLIEETYFSMSSKDIYSFFGKNKQRIHLFTQGEIVSDLRNRDQNFRLKFKMNNNQIKMYDKKNNLRIEVTINNPKDFKVLKEDSKSICNLGKSIKNLSQYVEVSENIIKRFIDALPDIDSDTLSLKNLENLSKPKIIKGRFYAPINIFHKNTIRIFQILADGKYLISGFTNKMIRQEYYSKNSEDPQNIEKMTRILLKFQAHKIIKKIPKSNRYYLTENGRKIITTILLFTQKNLL